MPVAVGPQEGGGVRHRKAAQEQGTTNPPSCKPLETGQNHALPGLVDRGNILARLASGQLGW